MPEYVVARDERLGGTLPNALVQWWNNLNVITTNAATPLRNLFDGVTSLHGSHGRMHTMFVLCHGFAGSSNRMRMSGDFGGQGLQLGREGVLHRNVSAWEAIKNKLNNIVVYACAAANTEDGNEFTTEDGQYLMGALAIHTNTTVYAANRIQWYQPRNFDFGRWEGQLYAFPPSGGSPRPVNRAPTELRQLT